MSLSESSESKNLIIMDWFVYICIATTGRYYVGISKNPGLRLARHNSGRGSRFARDQGPFKLKYISPAMSKADARAREIQIKGWSRAKKEKLISGVWF